MEKTIVNQNSTIMALQEDLELKEKCIVDLQDELTKKSQLIDQMEETILAQNDLIENVQKDVQEKNKCLTVLEEELKQKLQENEALKKQVSTLNENIINLNGVIEQNNHWHIEMKKEFDAQSANAIEREERLRLDYDQQVEKVKKDLGLITERKSMLETFLEKQVVYLLKRLQDFSEGRIPLDFSIGVFQKLFNEELEQLRLSHTLYSESSQSESFIRDLEELNKKLTACFSLEESLQIELQSKCKELQNVENELSETRKAYGALLSKERDTFSKLTQVELELNTLKCEKNQLQQHLAEANNNYEKVTVDFNRDRLEIEKKFKQILDNYETDLAILNKSLQELLHSIPSSFEIKDDNSTESEESSSTYLSPDIHSMISNPNIFNAQKIVSKCLHEIRKHNNNVKKSWLECQTLRLAIDVRNKALEEKDKQLTKVNDEIQLLKTKLDGIEDEKKYIHNKLNYVEGENVSYQLNIQSLNAKISDANETLKKYEDEINSLKQKEQSLLTEYAVCKKCNRSSLSPIMFDKKKVSCGSDSELLVRGGANTPDLSFQSLVDTGNRSPNIYTSTPFHRHNICDLEGGGEMSGPKPFKNQQELQLSLLKWMEKCHKLDSENKSLMLKIEDLELLNQDLKYSMNSVKEDMNTFEEKQINLEKRLNSFVLLKKETVSLSDEINLKDLTINHLLKDLEYLKCENVELFNNNLELEEKHRINLAKLSETKHVQHISGFGNTVTNVFNEKIKEIISLKGEINFLTNEKKCLSRKIELLLESNNTYVAKLNTVVEKLCYCEEELEKLNNEKLELMSSNKVLNKECQLLKIRVDYLSTLRDNHWCNPSSLSIIDEMQREVLIVFKTALENKMESTHFSVKDSEKNIEKIDSFNLPEVLKLLNQQLNDEKLDFEEKVNEFRHIIQSAQEQNVIGDHWIVQVDKLLRNIIEEMKYHKEQYFRIEEALRSTGKFHDELQKQKGELRIKEHEMNSFQKKFEEEKLKSKKSELHLKILEQEIQEKNELIKMLMDQKDTHERNITELQKRLSEAELKYDIDLKTAEWKNRVVELKSYRHEVDNKLQSIKDIECLENKEDIFSMELEEAEKHYIEALEEVKAFFKAESSTNIAQIQEEHKEQIEKLERIISEQAVRIGFLLKSNLNSGTDVPDSEIFYVNEDLRKQFELAIFALQQLHQEELQLLRLQLEAEKHNDIYQVMHHNINKIRTPICESSIKKKLSGAETNLLEKLEFVLRHDYSDRLKNFLGNWHVSYLSELSDIETNLETNIEDYRTLRKDCRTDEAKETEVEITDSVGHYAHVLDSVKEFLQNFKEEQNIILNNLKNFIKVYNDTTLECLEKIRSAHLDSNNFLKIEEELKLIKKERDDMEKRHKSAIELLHADHKAEQEKIHVLLDEIKKCCENGCDPNVLLKVKEDLEERHKKELEDLRAYYVQMCTNLEKQYSEDVNSLHSRMLSLSSSCSDEIISEQITDKSRCGNEIFSEFAPENIISFDKLSPEQVKLIEDLNNKWSDNVREMKKELENKYTRQLELLQERLSSFIYNNELDISVKCIKDEVMRDCKSEIEHIEKELSSRMLPFHEDIESLNSDNECSPCKVKWKSNSESDLAYEHLILDLMANFASATTLNKVSKEMLLVALKNTAELQENNFYKISNLFSTVEGTLVTVEEKIKDKENQLLSLQNKLNTFSQVVLRLTKKYKYFIDEAKTRKEIVNNTLLLEKLVDEGTTVVTLPPEILNLYTVFKNKYEKKLVEEKLKSQNEIKNLKDIFNKEKEEREESFQKDTVLKNDEFSRLIKERDSLKQMTSALKSAVSQLVSYLNTCEDELNKTVVDELLKICDDTPRKTSDRMNLENSPSFKRVHFAPDVGVSDLDETEDLSKILRLQLDSCLAKLKLEAASLLGLTALQPPAADLNKQIEDLRKENDELSLEITELKLRLEKNQDDSLELKDQLFSDVNKKNGSTFLQDKAQHLLSSTEGVAPDFMKLFEELAKFGDKLINELQKERTDLQMQIEAADKQLKSTRNFLEEQAIERETERDEYTKELASLQNQLKEHGKNWSSHERITSEIEELELELKEANTALNESEKKKEAIEIELKEAIDKVWVLRDIIHDLESQLSKKTEKEALYAQKLDELEAELDHQSGTQYAMAQELESLRSQNMEDSYLEQIKQLHENMKVQFSSSVVRQIKSQLRDMEKALEQRTKELETFYLSNSNNSLSSPSEEVSLREHLELCRSKTPEQCPSPVALPVDEVARLQDRLLRHARAEEILIKRLRDQQLSSAKLAVELEELHAEREAMQQQMKKQMVQLAESNNKIDDLRHKVELAQTIANKDLISQIQELKEKYLMAEQALDSMQNQMTENKAQLAHAEEIINKQQAEIRNLAHCDHEVVDTLRLELAAVTSERNKLEELLDKHKRDFNIDVMNALLADKNEDIDQLQHTVTLLRSQDEDEKQGSCNSKGYRVSFAAAVDESSFTSDDVRLRDAPQHNSLQILPENIQVFGGSISPILFDKEKDLMEYPSPKTISLSDSIIGPSTNDSEVNSIFQLNNLKLELTDKSEYITSLKEEIDYLKTVEIDLKNTKLELESVLSSVSNDKEYYEKELNSLRESVLNKDDEIKKLKKTMLSKDEEIIKTTADVQALHQISLNLQEKLKEATKLAENENNSILKEEINRLNNEIKDKEKEISDLQKDLLTYKNYLNNEKELCETVRSSLNTAVKEKLQLQEKIESYKIDNGSLMCALQTAEDNLERYVVAVKNLKTELFSGNELNVVSHLMNVNFEEGEFLKLKEEIVKVINLNESLKEERAKLLKEVEDLKLQANSADFLRKDLLITQLQEELKKLQKAVLTIKEEKLTVFSNFSSEINQLHKDINDLHDSKNEAIEKWKIELSEKKTLQEMYNSLKTELNVEKQKNASERQLATSRERTLSRNTVESIDIPPVTYVPGLDALTEQMRKEIKLSATLDNSLLESILPDNNKAMEVANNSQEIPSMGISEHESCICKVRSLEKAMMCEVGKAREAKNALREKENKCRELETEICELKLCIDRWRRHIGNQNERINQLLSQIESHKEKIISLELNIVKEQCNFKQVSSLLEEETSKAREVQRDDITLIETMRQRLQNLMENEIKLKKMVIEERQKSEALLAELNSVKAYDKYRSDSDDEAHKNVKRMILKEREKFLSMKVECEKEKRTCEDLKEVIARERATLNKLKDNLAKSNQMRHHLEKELSMLQQQFDKEILKRQFAENRCIETNKQLEVVENKNKKSLDAAYAIIHDLQQEYNELKRHLQDQQEQDDNWKENVHAPLIQQLNEVNDNLDALVKERINLKRTIEQISEENSRLHSLVSSLRAANRRESTSSMISSSDVQPPDIQFRGIEAITPFMEREVDNLLRRAIFAERHCKALIFQKRYLLVALRGYQNSHSEAVLRLQHHYRLRCRPLVRMSFRSAALAVIAAIKISKLPLKRLMDYNNKKDGLFRALKTSVSRSTAEAERLAAAPSTRLAAPHSPPSRDRTALRYR